MSVHRRAAKNPVVYTRMTCVMLKLRRVTSALFFHFVFVKEGGPAYEYQFDGFCAGVFQRMAKVRRNNNRIARADLSLFIADCHQTATFNDVVSLFNRLMTMRRDLLTRQQCLFG